MLATYSLISKCSLPFLFKIVQLNLILDSAKYLLRNTGISLALGISITSNTYLLLRFCLAVVYGCVLGENEYEG